MRTIRIVLAILLLHLAGIIGCNGGGGSLPPGFGIITQEEAVIDGVPFFGNVPDIVVNGSWVSGGTGAVVAFYEEASDDEGYFYIDNGRAPASWQMTELNGDCAGDSTVGSVNAQAYNYLTCHDAPLSASPSSFDHSSPPATLTVSGTGMSEEYGMPSVMIFDVQGDIYYYGPADTCAPDMSWVGVGSEDLAHLPAGYYGIAVGNVLSDGTVQPVGSAQFQVTLNNGVPTGLSVQPTSVVMNGGDGAYLTAELSYSDGSWVNVTYLATWTSSDPDFATVGTGYWAGYVTGMDVGIEGSATITASYQGFQGSCLVTVFPAAPPPQG